MIIGVRIVQYILLVVMLVDSGTMHVLTYSLIISIKVIMEYMSVEHGKLLVLQK